MKPIWEDEDDSRLELLPNYPVNERRLGFRKEDEQESGVKYSDKKTLQVFPFIEK